MQQEPQSEFTALSFKIYKFILRTYSKNIGQFVNIQKMAFLGFYEYLCKYLSNLAENLQKMGYQCNK